MTTLHAFEPQPINTHFPNSIIPLKLAAPVRALSCKLNNRLIDNHILSRRRTIGLTSIDTNSHSRKGTYII